MTLIAVITTARKSQVNLWLESNVGSRIGADQFSIPLSATGQLPATHWATDWAMFHSTHWDKLQAFATAKNWIWVWDAGVIGSFDAAVSSIGLKRIESQLPGA